MKAKIIIIVLAVMVSLLFPLAVLAAPGDYYVSGTIYTISDANEQPAGGSGRYVVYERTVTGNFDSGSITGPFSLVYKANVDGITQAGTLSGSITSGDYTFSITGKSNPVTWMVVDGYPTGKLDISGNWKSTTKGHDGQGTYNATMYFIPTADGHVAAVLQGSFAAMSGQMK